MTNYTLSINDDQTIANLTETEAREQADLYAADGDAVTISWYRESDGQHGFLNRDGHGVTGKIW